MNYQYRSSDRSDAFVVLPADDDLVAAIASYTALLLRRNIEIATGLVDQTYNYPSLGLIRDLVLDEHGHEMQSFQLEQILRDDELPNIIINYGAFPDATNQLPYDEILGKMCGAFHGLHALIFKQEDGYFSPGQVLDISQLLDFVGLEEMEIGHPRAREVFMAFHAFFQRTANRQDAITFGWVSEPDEDA